MPDVAPSGLARPSHTRSIALRGLARIARLSRFARGSGRSAWTAIAAMFPALAPVGYQTSVRWYGSKFAQPGDESHRHGEADADRYQPLNEITVPSASTRHGPACPGERARKRGHLSRQVREQVPSLACSLARTSRAMTIEQSKVYVIAAADHCTMNPASPGISTRVGGPPDVRAIWRGTGSAPDRSGP